MYAFGAIIFLGAIGGITVVLILVFYCIKKELCCCQRIKHSNDDDTDGDEPLLEQFEEEPLPKNYPQPYAKVAMNEQCDFREKAVEAYMSDPQTSDMSGDDILNLPKPYMSVKTRENSIDTDSQFNSGEILGKYKKMKRDVYIDGCKLKLSLLYSKEDLFLMLSLNEITGLPNKANGGYDLVRLSITLLPEKKYKSKSKYQVVDETSTTFDDTFKFSNVTRESLFTSAFRIRLYGKRNVARETCVGEMIIQLADVAQRAGGFVTWKKFERKK